MSNEFTSHASNFISAMQTGVDPRTGQFFFNFPLLEAQANNLLGPNIFLGVAYSSLSAINNFKLGKGVTLTGISSFDQRSGRITLSSGESWEVSGSGNITNRKLKDCIFKHKDSSTKLLYWKNGTTEVLGKLGTDKYFTKQIITPLGKQVHFEWVWGGVALLRSIKDGNNTIICQFDYKGSSVLNGLIPGTEATITVWPNTPVSYKIGFYFQNDNLASIIRQSSNNDPNKVQWIIGYTLINQKYFPIKLTHPTGMVENINYDMNALKFPVGGLKVPFPAVTRYTRSYGRGQPDTVTSYTYTSNNFLGNNASPSVFGKWSNNKDYLYSMLTTNYTYGSTEITYLNNNINKQITRKYNNYHLLISEEETQKQCTILKETIYHANYDTDISKQPTFYTFPKEQITTYKSNGKPRTERIYTTFDDYGNPLTIKHHDGSQEKYEWYSAKGEETKCPAEPNGFVRFIKKKTVIPAANKYPTPIYATEYTYKKIGNQNCIVQDSVTNTNDSDKICLKITKTQYEENVSSAEFGRIIVTEDILYDISDKTKNYTSSKKFNTNIDSTGIMTQKVIHTSYDNLTTEYTRTQSVYNGSLLTESNEQEIKVKYTYDSLGRILTKTHAVDTPYSSTIKWSYELQNGYPITTKEDALGNKIRSFFDGAGRVVKTDTYDADISSKWYTISSTYYDSLGRVIKNISYDWSTDDRKNNATSPSISAQTEHVYDNWGSETKQISSDGTTNIIEYDPISLTKTVYTQNSQNSNISSGKKVTILNEFSKLPLEDNIYTTDNKLIGSHKYEWDALGQLRKQIDINGNITQWEYDIYGRVIKQTLPDNSLVEQAYTPYFTDKKAIKIGVRESSNLDLKVIGTRSYDGLGRLTQNVCGNRITKYTYDKYNPLPKEVSLPSGNTLEYQYIPELGNKTSKVIGKNTEKQQAILKNFNYDKTTYNLLSHIESQFNNSFRYTSSGALEGENFEYNKVRNNTSYKYSLNGVIESYVDISNYTTTYTRDSIGRIIEIKDPTLTVKIKYDNLNRLAERKVISNNKTTPNELTTTLLYDDFSREIERTINNKNNKITIKQTWLNNGLLSSKETLQNNTTVKKEVYSYDNRNRLVEYTVTGKEAPIMYGNTLSKQSYTYDVLNNITKVVTTHTDNTSNIASYKYNNANDINQLTSVEHTHKSYPPVVTLKYDSEGRMIKDNKGRELSYDILGRLMTIKSEKSNSKYEYDATNRLTTQTINDNKKTLLFYRGEELVNEVDTNIN